MFTAEITATIVNAFSNEVTGGNPAAVVELTSWLSDEQLLFVAASVKQPVTSFIVPDGDKYRIRWFSQEKEINLCGHGSLAAAQVIFEQGDNQVIYFVSEHGNIVVARKGSKVSINMPIFKEIKSAQYPSVLGQNPVKPTDVFSTRDLVVVLESQAQVEAFEPSFKDIAKINQHALIVTAKGDESDYVLRYFVPKVGIDEDAATGSAQCSLAPYWAEQLDKKHLSVKQLSKRSGTFSVQVDADSIEITTQAVIVGQHKIPLIK